MDKNTHYFICGDYMNDTYSALESYIYDVIKPKQLFSPTAQVKISKQVAGILGMKKKTASTIIVDLQTKDELAKHFDFDGKTLGVLRLADLEAA
tara:strand:+ start:58 stop:339 length:282 start_codon:yes stop_codon:yes gene_type:complete